MRGVADPGSAAGSRRLQDVGLEGGLLGLLTSIIVAIAVYGMPLHLALRATAYGATFGLFPIAWIVFWALALYRLTVDTGQFEIIKNSVGHLTQDRRLQALLIAFAFGAFIEGASGFGTPVAVAAAMLSGLDSRLSRRRPSA